MLKKVYACEKSNIVNCARILIHNAIPDSNQIEIIHKDILKCTLEDFGGEKVDVIRVRMDGSLFISGTYVGISDLCS